MLASLLLLASAGAHAQLSALDTVVFAGDEREFDNNSPHSQQLLSSQTSYVFGERLEQRLFNNWDVRTSLHYNDGAEWHDEDELDSLTIDLQRSVLRSDTGSELALGVGWQRSFQDATREGPRLTLTGRVQLGHGVRLYGQTAWLPNLDADSAHPLDPRDPSEFEAGFSYDVVPSFSVRAGVRWFQNDGEAGTSLFGQRRFMLGAGVRW